MWDWLSNVAGGLAGLFGGGAADTGILSDAANYLAADPAPYSFGVEGITGPMAGTDIAGGAASPGLTFNDISYGGTPYSFTDPVTGDIVSGATRPSVINPATGEALGFNNGSGGLVNLNGAPLTGVGTGFSDLTSGVSPRLSDFIKNGTLGNLAGPGGGGGDRTANLSLPATSSPVADRITPHPVPAMQTGAIPNTPPPANDFKPLMLPETPGAPPALPAGLQRLFQRMGIR